MMKLTKEQQIKWWVFLGAAFVLFLAYCGFLNHSFTSDHVNIFMDGTPPYTRPTFDPFFYIKTGLGLNVIFFWLEYLFAKVGVTKDVNQYVLQLVGILLMSGATTLLYGVFEKYLKNIYQKILLVAVLLVQFINPYFCEVMLYVAYEKIFGVIAAIFATILFTKKKYIGAFICVVLAVSSYQVYYVLFLIYTSTWIFLEAHGNFTKETLFSYIKLYMTMIIPGVLFVLLYLSSKLWGIGTYVGKAIPMDVRFWDRIGIVKQKYLQMMVTQQGLLPKYFLMICFVVFGILLLALWKRKRINNWLYGIAHVFVMTLYPVSIYFVATNTQATGRIIWCIFSALSGIMIVALEKCDERISKIKLFAMVLGLFLCMDVYSVTSTISNIYISNALDEQIVSQIVVQIEDYERSSGNSIQKIAAAANRNSKCSYPQVSFLEKDYSNEDAGYYNFTHKAMDDEWANEELFIYLTGRKYKIVNMPETIWQEHFAGKGWVTFYPQEQLYFEGDTLYWCIY